MAPTTAVHCPGCGHDNNPQYRFCGMCGTALRGEMPPARPKSAPLTVGGYSILGLAQHTLENTPAIEVEPTNPRHDNAARVLPSRPDALDTGFQSSDSSLNSLLNRNLDYLFEDDDHKKRPPRWRLYVALVLLVIAAGTLVWQWQRNGYPWDDLSPLTRERIGETAPRRASDAAPYSKPPDTLAPAADSQLKSPDSDLPKPEKPAQETASAMPRKAPQISTTFRPQPTSSVTESSDPGSAPAAIAPVGGPQASSPAEAIQLLADGTKYLLGNGVTQDCDLANKDLRAASRFSSDAEAMLGTMYASGHCVDRDLPTAYRWYARALRSKPGNSRIQDDLTALWNQMTPAEKKVAIRNDP